MRDEAGTIYLKIDRNSCVTHPKVLLSDIAKIECENPEILRKVKYLPIYNFGSRKKGEAFHSSVAMSILKVVELIHQERPRVLVINEGESDFIIEYLEPPKVGSWFDKVKVAVLSVIIFFGSAYSIMAFNNDVDISGMFDKFYLQVLGNTQTESMVLEVSYCIGLALGIMIFFNHVGMKKITPDPTPLQVQMRKYENDIDMTFIENASRGEHNIDVE